MNPGRGFVRTLFGVLEYKMNIRAKEVTEASQPLVEVLIYRFASTDGNGTVRVQPTLQGLHGRLHLAHAVALECDSLISNADGKTEIMLVLSDEFSFTDDLIPRSRVPNTYDHRAVILMFGFPKYVWRHIFVITVQN